MMHDCKNPATEKYNHLEAVSLRYEKLHGNIVMATFSFLTHGMSDDSMYFLSQRKSAK